jgi:hypothetical protein
MQMYHDIDLEMYSIDCHYRRAGKECLFDPVREMLIIKTPEEIVRQKFVGFLREVMNVPRQMIDIEVPMSDFKARGKGRADIVVYGLNANDERIPVVVIECKAPNITLNDYTTDQVMNYDSVLCANTIITTNGTYMKVMNKQGQVYRSLAVIPSYNQLIQQKDLVYVEDEDDDWERPDFCDINREDWLQCYIDNCWISAVTDKKIGPFLINLAGFIQDDRERLEPQQLFGLKIIQDGGIRFFSYGNAAGGSWPGRYRYFVLEDEQGNNQIVNISIMSTATTVNDPVFGNTRGNSTLVVAVDDFDKRHNSLQLNIDKYLRNDGQEYYICHDGTLTAGKSGAVKRADVIKYIKQNAPGLLDEQEKVFLGKFDNTHEISWEQEETVKFIGRTIKYALIRDEFRRTKNAAK